MNYILGLDISTTTIGWALIFKEDGRTQSVGHITFKKGLDLWDKLNHFKEQSNQFLGSDISAVSIEEPLKGFKPGLSSAQTLSLLSQFNGMVSATVFNITGIKPVHINASTARSSVGIRIDTKDKTKTTKQKILEQVKFKDNNIPWTGKKGDEDAADAWVVAQSFRTLFKTSNI
jgi:Holliday junction resolvasome RuvABC endonuclease subunit